MSNYESYITISNLSDIGVSDDTLIAGALNNSTGKFTISSVKNFLLAGSKDCIFNDVDINKIKLSYGNNLVINNGSIIASTSLHKIDTEGESSNDDLSSITGSFDTGSILILSSLNNSRIINIKVGIGNILYYINNDIVLDNTNKYIILLNTGTNITPMWSIIGGNALCDLNTTLPLQVGVYTLSTLPNATNNISRVIVVSDSTPSHSLCVSNGSVWVNQITGVQVV